MDGIIGLGHFCETHGPCIILATQRYETEPQQKPHSLIVPWCEACESLQLDQAFVSKDETNYYVTTRTPLQQEDAFLMRQAAVRSVSCEQEGTLYFGDNERGHVYSHCFVVHDSLARGFQRKYTIMVLMRDKLKLLNSWRVFSKHIEKITDDLLKSSEIVNKNEQKEKSQKSLRQSEGSPSNVSRSLAHLTGKPGIYAHLHLWFVWILGCPVATESSSNVPATFVTPAASSYLRIMYQEMGDVFSKVLMLFLNGASVQCDDELVVNGLKSIWPMESPCLEGQPGKLCCIYRKNNKWEIETKLDVTMPKSKLQRDLECILGDNRVTDKTLQYQIAAMVLTWINASNVLLTCPQIDLNLLKCLNVTKNDILMLSYIISKYSSNKCEQIISHLNTIYQK